MREEREVGLLGEGGEGGGALGEGGEGGGAFG